MAREFSYLISSHLMLILLVWEPTLTSTGINTGQASQVKCVFVLLKFIHIFYVNDLFGIEIGNLLLLNVSRINALFLSVFKSILRFFFFNTLCNRRAWTLSSII